MLILETMTALTREELVCLLSESREDLPEPAGLYDDCGEIVPGVLVEHMADVFIRMQKRIDSKRRRGSPRAAESSGCTR